MRGGTRPGRAAGNEGIYWRTTRKVPALLALLKQPANTSMPCGRWLLEKRALWGRR
jgi:hypothetical protein